MSRPLPTDFVPILPTKLGPQAVVRRGAATGYQGEQDLARNIHWLYAYDRPIWCHTIWTGDSDGGPWVEGGSNVLKGFWHRDLPPAPFTQMDLRILVENAGTTDGTVRFDWASDPWLSGGSPGTSVDITVAGATSQWLLVSDVLDLPAGVSADTLRMWITNGDGDVRVHSVTAWPAAPSSIIAGPVTVDGWRWVPHDTLELAEFSPVSVALRRAEWANLRHIDAVRTGTVIAWCDVPQWRATYEAHATTSATDVLVKRTLFRVPPGVTRLRWAVWGFRAGTEGYVTLTTDTDVASGEAAQEVALGSTWTTPFSAGLHKHDDGSYAELGCTPEAWNELLIYLRSDGSSSAKLLGLSVWFEVPA